MPIASARGAALVAALTLAVGAPAATAGTPFTVIAEHGAGQERVAVDSAGAAHIVWVSTHPTSGLARLRYCKLSRTASACPPGEARTLWPRVSSGDQSVAFSSPRIFVTAADAVIVVSDIVFDSALPRATYMFRSSSPDGTFESGPTRAAPNGYLSSSGGPSAALAPRTSSGDKVAFAVARSYYEGPAADSAGAMLTQNFPSGTRGKEEVVATTQGGVRLVVGHGGTTPPGQVEFNRYDGTGNPNLGANWTGPQPAGPGTRALVAGGPAGVVLASKVALGGDVLREQFVVRKYNPSTFGFGSGVGISDIGDPIFADLFANPATGQFHFLFMDSARDLRWTTSTDGVTWSPAHLIARRADLRSRPADVAAGPDGSGMAVWDGNPAGGSPRESDQIHAVRLEPIPEGEGGGSGGDSTGGDGSTSGGTTGVDGGTGGAAGDFTAEPKVVVDESRPVIDGFRIGDRTLVQGQRTSFHFSSTEPGGAQLRIERQVRGISVRRRGTTRLSCRPASRRLLSRVRRELARRYSGRRLERALRSRRCRVYRRVVLLRREAVAGRNRISFSGRVSGRRLRRGTYRATLRVKDPAGNVSRPAKLRFGVRAPGRAL